MFHHSFVLGYASQLHTHRIHEPLVYLNFSALYGEYIGNYTRLQPPNTNLAGKFVGFLVHLRWEKLRNPRNARWISHHGMELDLELQEFQTLWTLSAAGTRQVMELWHDATHDACSSGELPDYGGKGSCVALIESFSNSGLGKGRASFYLECFWGKVICHGHGRQDDLNIAWWTANWCADFSRSVVRGLDFSLMYFILLSYGLRCRLVLSIVFIQMYFHSFDFLVRLVLSIVFIQMYFHSKPCSQEFTASRWAP